MTTAIRTDAETWPTRAEFNRVSAQLEKAAEAVDERPWWSRHASA